MGYDVSKSKLSIAGKLEPLIGEMNGMNYDQIRESFTRIINDPDTSASPETRNKWRIAISRAQSKVSIMSAISNLYLKGAQLGLK